MAGEQGSGSPCCSEGGGTIAGPECPCSRARRTCLAGSSSGLRSSPRSLQGSGPELHGVARLGERRGQSSGLRDSGPQSKWGRMRRPLSLEPLAA